MKEYNKLGLCIWLIFGIAGIVVNLYLGLGWVIGTYVFEEFARNKEKEK